MSRDSAPFRFEPRSLRCSPERHPHFAAFRKQFDASVSETRKIFSHIDSSPSPAVKAARRVADRQLRDMAEDFDLYLWMGLIPDPDQYPHSHALQSARLAIAIGAVLNMDERALVELGQGSLLHDSGMLKVDSPLLKRERPFDALERLSVHKHPGISSDLVKGAGGLSVGTRMVVYQMHERLDGSGYPRRRTAGQIHPYAKIAMVADMFVALTSRRPQRLETPPYYAMVELLESARQGQVDSQAVKALLEAVSLFPIGSFVELSDGRTARVIGANRSVLDRPLVEIVDSDGTPSADCETVNLPDLPDLTVLRPVLHPGLHQALWTSLAEDPAAS